MRTITNEYSSKVVDRNKKRRERKKTALTWKGKTRIKNLHQNIQNTRLKTRLKRTHLDNVCFIKQNQLKRTKVKLFSFFHFMCVVVIMHSNCFVWPIYTILNGFYAILTFHFKYPILYTCKLSSLAWRKSTQVREGTFFLKNEWN